jgi:hypothetical protein
MRLGDLDNEAEALGLRVYSRALAQPTNLGLEPGLRAARSLRCTWIRCLPAVGLPARRNVRLAHHDFECPPGWAHAQGGE